MNSKKYLIINIIIFIIAIIVVVGTFLFLVKNNFLSSVGAEEADTDPPILSDINIPFNTATGTIITWKTDEEADSIVNYGLDRNYGIARDPLFDNIEHNILVNDLVPATTYYFRVISSDSSGNQAISGDYSFVTPGENQEGGDQEGDQEGKGTEQEDEAGKGPTEEENNIEDIIEMLKEVTDPEAVELISQELQEIAEKVVTAPVLGSYPEVEVGTNYAIFRWLTDVKSNSMVALVNENDYDNGKLDPYKWKEGEPEEMVVQHEIEVNGLSPNTVYHFQVSSRPVIGLPGQSLDHTFTTKSILPEVYNIRVVKTEEYSATLAWATNVPTSAIIEYTNLDTNKTKLAGSSAMITSHNLQLTNLEFDTTYSAIIHVENEQGEKADSNIVTFTTVRDKFAPIISKVNTESTIYPGSDNKIQTIVSWDTDEVSVCQFFYHQGLIILDEEDSLEIESDYTSRHVQVATNFLPSTVYKFWIKCYDVAENEARSEDFTMLTPTQEESIIDIILRNFESTFGWVKKLKK